MTWAHYQDVVWKANGQPAAGASITVLASDGVTPVTVYSAASLAAPIASLKSDGDGNFGFWVIAGTYTITVALGTVSFSYVVSVGDTSEFTDALTTVFNADGSVSETHTGTGVVKTTTFPADGSIVEMWGPPVNKTKTTTFNADGSISETIA